MPLLTMPCVPLPCVPLPAQDMTAAELVVLVEALAAMSRWFYDARLMNMVAEQLVEIAAELNGQQVQRLQQLYADMKHSTPLLSSSMAVSMAAPAPLTACACASSAW